MLEYLDIVATQTGDSGVNEHHTSGYASVLHPAWITISTFCRQVAHMALPILHSQERIPDEHKAVTDASFRLSYPLYNNTKNTHVRFTDKGAIICTPVQIHSRIDPYASPMVRLESGTIIAGKLCLRSTLVSEAVYLMWCEDAIPYDIFNYIELTPDILMPVAKTESTPLIHIFKKLLTDGKGISIPLAAALIMTRWYQMVGTERFTSIFPGEWSTGQIIQLQGLLTDHSIKSSAAISAVRNEFTRLVKDIENHSAGKNCMNFIAYSYLRMLLSDNPINICNITNNMPPEFRNDFNRMIFIRD